MVCAFMILDGPGRMGCKALKERICQDRTCPFYKTLHQLRVEDIAARDRWRRLGLYELASRYTGGYIHG